MIKVFCFYVSKPFRPKQFAKVYPEVYPKVEKETKENVIESVEPTIIRHINILEKKECESNQNKKPSIFTFE